MTIKPIITNQKSKDDGTEENQNLGGTNSPNREKRKNGVVFEESGARHVRRAPQKSSNRLKRDQQKRLEQAVTRTGESHSKGAYASLCPLGVNVSANATAAALGRASSPKAICNATVAQVAGQGGELLHDEAQSGYNSGDEHHGRDAGMTEIEWKQRDDEFAKTLAKEGLIVKEIEEDGACLFRSISLQIYGDQDMHEDIRQQTMDYISQNREYFAQFVTEDIASYIARKRKKNVHGNHIEIQAMSEIYNRPVELYCYQTKPINIFNSEQRNNGYEPLRLSYQRSSHYNAILDPYKASVGVGLGLAGYKPDELDLKQVQQAVRVSEELEIEQTMFEDKLKTTDWEATNEAIEEQIARESYLQWCRENMQRTKKSVSATVTSATSQANHSLYMPGSSSGSSAALSMGMSGGSAETMSSMATAVAAMGECNNNATATLISCKVGGGGSAAVASAVAGAAAAAGTESSVSTSTIAGRMSPKQQQQQQYQSDDGLKSNGSSSTCTSTASSSSSSGSSSLFGENNFDGMLRQRRRRRRHNGGQLQQQQQMIYSHTGMSSGERISPPELGTLNLLETRSTDSNDSDFSDETMSKKMKRRVERNEDLKVEEKEKEQKEKEMEQMKERKCLNFPGGEPLVDVADATGGEQKKSRSSGSSVGLTEPGPSKSGPEMGERQPVNFYHSLLESSYAEDGSIQMTEDEMIQRAIQMSRIDYITMQKHSDYDSP